MNRSVSKLIQKALQTLLSMARLACAALAILLGNAASAGTIPVPNASFETPFQPGAPYYASPYMDYWQETPQPCYYNPTNFDDTPWSDLVGEFTNDPGDGAYITNCDGTQAAFLQSLPGVGIYQDYTSFSDTQGGPTYAFNAKYQVGKSYTLTAGIIGDSEEGLPQGATLQMSLYYRDASNNMVTVSSMTITNTTNLFTNNLGFVDFQLDVPTVQATNAWAGQNIGIEFLVTVGFDNLGGDWDVDNVRLVEHLNLPNASFESPPQPGAPYYASPYLDYWQETPQPGYYNPTNFDDTPWADLTGGFTNDPGDGAYILNCDGTQAAFLQSLPGVGLFQDYTSFSDTQGGPTYAFNSVYQVGKSYTLTAGIIGDSEEGLPQGATMQMLLYYRDASSNMVTVASTTITNTTNTFPDNLHFVNFTVQTPPVVATNAWAGQNIGIEFLVTVGFDNLGGDWDVDNVRLTENPAPPALLNPVLVNGQGSFGLQSTPGLSFNILTCTNVATPATNWSTITTVTNTEGGLWITDPGAPAATKFYRAQQL